MTTEEIKQIQVGGHKKGKNPIMFTIVDSDVFEKLNQYKWSALGNSKRGFYATRWSDSSQKEQILMHHEIIGKPKKGIYVDHINGNSLDNRKENLRFVTPQQNVFNSKDNIKNKTGCKGVSLLKKNNVYRAFIGFNGKRIHLGSFPPTPEGLEMASKIYQDNVLKLHKEHARKN